MNYESFTMKSESDAHNYSHNKDIHEEALVRSLFYDNRVLTALTNLRKNLDGQLMETIASEKNKQGQYLMDVYIPTEIIKIFNGLEIHNLQKVYSRLKNGISLISFILIGLRILDYHPDHVLYFINGMIDLHSSLAQAKHPNKAQELSSQKILFEDFVSYFMKIQAILGAKPVAFDDPIKMSLFKRFTPSKTVYDSSNHQNSVKCVHYDLQTKIIFTLDDCSSNIRMYDCQGTLLGKINTTRDKHRFENILINDFAWSEKERKLFLCCQDQTVSFFEADNKFSVEHVYETELLQTHVWHIAEYQTWFLTDTLDNLSVWNDSTKKLERTDIKLDGNLSDIVAMHNMSLVVFAAFNRKLIIWDMVRKAKFLDIPLNETSAHTLRYHAGLSYLYVASFEHTAKVYQIDKSKDYTVVGKLDHPISVTALELIHDHDLVLTCDESGTIKSWDPRTLKCIQTFKFHNKKRITQINNLQGVNMFFCVTNRLQFFHFGAEDHTASSNVRILRNVVIDIENNELIVGTPFDLRAFNLHYGLLTGLFDKENYGINDKIENFFRRKKTNSLIYYNEVGEISELLPLFQTNRSNTKLKPFADGDISFVRYIEKYELLICAAKSQVKIYKYQSNNISALLRVITFPGEYSITELIVNTVSNYLVIVLNNQLALFFEFQKATLIGCYINCEISQNESKNSYSPLNYTQKNIGGQTTKMKNDKKISYFARTPHVGGKSFSNATNEVPPSRISIPGQVLSNVNSPRNSGLIATFDAYSSPSQNSVGDRQDDQIVSGIEGQLGSISSFLFVKDYNCFIAIDYQSQVTLVEPQDLPKLKSKIKIAWETMPTGTEYFSVVKYKKVSTRKQLAFFDSPAEVEKMEKAGSTKISNFNLAKKLTLIDSPHLSPSKSGADQHYLLFGHSNGCMSIVKIEDVLERYFSHVSDNSVSNPYSKCEATIKEPEITKALEKTRSANQNSNCYQNTVDLSEYFHKSWQAHSGEISTLEIIYYTSHVIVSIGTDLYLRIWNFRAEKLCELSLVSMRHTKWNISNISVDQRVQSLKKVSDFVDDLDEIYPELQTKIEERIQGKQESSSKGFKSNKKIEEETKEVNPKKGLSPLSIIKSNSRIKKPVEIQESKGQATGGQPKPKVEKIDAVQLAALNADYLLRRDHEIYNNDALQRRKKVEEKKQIEHAIFMSLMEQSRNPKVAEDKLLSIDRIQTLEKRLEDIYSPLPGQPDKQIRIGLDQRPAAIKTNDKGVRSKTVRPKRTEFSLDSNDPNQSSSQIHSFLSPSLAQPSKNSAAGSRVIDNSNLLSQSISGEQHMLSSIGSSKRDSIVSKSDIQPSIQLKLPSINRAHLVHQRNPSYRHYYQDSSTRSLTLNTYGDINTTNHSDYNGKELDLSSSRSYKNLPNQLYVSTEGGDDQDPTDSRKMRTNRDTRQSILKDLDQKRKQFQNGNSSARLPNNTRIQSQIQDISRNLSSSLLPTLKHLNNIAMSPSPRLAPRDIANSFSTIQNRTTDRGDQVKETVPEVSKHEPVKDRIKTDDDYTETSFKKMNVNTEKNTKKGLRFGFDDKVLSPIFREKIGTWDQQFISPIPSKVSPFRGKATNSDVLSAKLRASQSNTTIKVTAATPTSDFAISSQDSMSRKI